MKKIIAMLVSMIMVISMGITAFAAGNGSITIDNAVVGETYSIYRIFDLESYSDNNPDDDTDGQYAYKTNTKWSAFANQDTIKDVYVNIDAQGYVTWVENADAEAFAKAAKAYADANSIAPDATPVEATSTTVSFTGLELGYYLVDTSLGSLCSLDTTNPSVIIEEKNEQPTIEKEVQEDSDDSWGDNNDADITQTVNFKATITAKKGATNYVMHDKMSAGLDFGSVTGITMNATTVNPSNYTVVTSGADLCADCDFHVNFHQEFLDTITADSTIVVSYTATVNSGAVIGNPGNPNDVKLEYGDEQETNWDQTITYVWELNIFKHTTTGEGDAAVDTPLAGAEFILYKTVDSVNHYAKITNGKLTGWTTTEADATTLVSPDTGFIYIEGLDADTYFLQETKAPAGYNIMTPNPKEVTIGANGAVGETVTIPAEGDGEDTSVDHVIKVLNQSGSELPSTGGIGTTIFYIIGSILMIGAVVLLITKKKMSVSED